MDIRSSSGSLLIPHRASRWRRNVRCFQGPRSVSSMDRELHCEGNSMTGFGRVAAWLMMLAPLGAALGASCTVVHHAGSTTGSGSTGSGGDSDGGGGSTPAETGREIF